MKTIYIKYSFFLVALLSLTSCNKWIHKPFTSVEKIVNVKNDMTVEEVNATLGITPYDIFHMQDDGTSILLYNYRLQNRNMRINGFGKANYEKQITTERSQTEGAKWYGKEVYQIYVIFKNGRVRNMVTDPGVTSSETVILMNNDIKVINSAKDFRGCPRPGHT